jgi:hypothetical protein
VLTVPDRHFRGIVGNGEYTSAMQAQGGRVRMLSVMRRDLLIRLLALSAMAALIVFVAPRLSSGGTVTFRSECQLGANTTRICSNPGAQGSSGIPLPESVIWGSGAILWLIAAVHLLRKRGRKLPDWVPYV